jgi:hypothetical protein
VNLGNRQQRALLASILGLLLMLAHLANAQDTQGKQDVETNAGFIPAITGGAGYIHHVEGGVTTLEPQVAPVLLVPFGHHVLLESRATFFGFFQRENQTSGPWKGKVFNSVDYAQLNWLANTHVIGSAGKYLLPFGLYSERLEPVWIHNLQDAPITASIGTRTSGAGLGPMLRGVAVQHPGWSIQYTAYFSALSNTHQLQAARTTGFDTSIFFSRLRLEAGTSYQRFLQQHHVNSVATYIAWHPRAIPVDIKAEGDYTYSGRGYWIETAYLFKDLPIHPIFRRTQIVGRMQQFFPLNGGGNGLPGVTISRFDFGLNYYFRDDLRIVSSYGRSFSSPGNANVWNVGATYRFMFPLWPARKK